MRTALQMSYKCELRDSPGHARHRVAEHEKICALHLGTTGLPRPRVPNDLCDVAMARWPPSAP